MTTRRVANIPLLKVAPGVWRSRDGLRLKWEWLRQGTLTHDQIDSAARGEPS